MGHGPGRSSNLNGSYNPAPGRAAGMRRKEADATSEMGWHFLLRLTLPVPLSSLTLCLCNPLSFFRHFRAGSHAAMEFHRHLPSRALHWNDAPFRVLAPHLAKCSPSAACCHRKSARIARYSNFLKLSQSIGAHSSHLASRFFSVMNSINCGLTIL